MRDTLKKHSDFLPGENDLDARSTVFFVRAKPTRFPGHARYGLTASKRVFKLATQRNRAKRLLRDWIRHNERYLCDDLDYVFIARFGILDAKRPDGRAAVRRTLRYIKRTHEKSKK